MQIIQPVFCLARTEFVLVSVSLGLEVVLIVFSAINNVMGINGPQILPQCNTPTLYISIKYSQSNATKMETIAFFCLCIATALTLMLFLAMLCRLTQSISQPDRQRKQMIYHYSNPAATLIYVMISLALLAGIVVHAYNLTTLVTRNHCQLGGYDYLQLTVIVLVSGVLVLVLFFILIIWTCIMRKLFRGQRNIKTTNKREGYYIQMVNNATQITQPQISMFPKFKKTQPQNIIQQKKPQPKPIQQPKPQPQPPKNVQIPKQIPQKPKINYEEEGVQCDPPPPENPPSRIIPPESPSEVMRYYNMQSMNYPYPGLRSNRAYDPDSQMDDIIRPRRRSTIRKNLIAEQESNIRQRPIPEEENLKRSRLVSVKQKTGKKGDDQAQFRDEEKKFLQQQNKAKINHIPLQDTSKAKDRRNSIQKRLNEEDSTLKSKAMGRKVKKGMMLSYVKEKYTQ